MTTLDKYIEARKALRKAEEDLTAALYADDITPVELWTLSFSQDRTIGEIATFLGVTTPRVTYLTTNLQDHGYLNIKPNPEDRRQRFCTVTQKGKGLLERMG